MKVRVPIPSRWVTGGGWTGGTRRGELRMVEQAEAEWRRVLRETSGLVEADLLYVAVDWLQRDAAMP